MAQEVTITKDGAIVKELKGTEEEMADLRSSYAHLCDLRNEVIELGAIPAVEKWAEINPNLK